MDSKRLERLRLLFFLLSVMLSTHFSQSYGQNVRLIDSLKNILPSQTGHDAFETLDKIAFEYTDFINEEAYKHSKPLYRMAFVLGDSLKIVRAGVRLGAVLRRLEKTDSAILIYNKILSIGRRHGFKQQVKYITNGLGIINVFKANYDKALEYYLESLALRRESKSLDEVSIILNNIAIVYYKMKFYEKALPYFEESLRIKRVIRDYYDYDNVLINSGLCHVFLKHYHKSIKIFQDGIEFFGDSTSMVIRGSGHYGLGVAYFGMNDLEKAQGYFSSSYKLSRKSNHIRLQADNLVYLGKISFALGKRHEGISQLVESEGISKINEYNELLITVYEELIRMFKSMNDHGQLSAYQKKLIDLREEVYSATMVGNLTASETKLKSLENSIMLAQQQETLKLNTQLIGKNRVLNISAFGLLTLLGILLYILYRSIQLNRRLSSDLEVKVELRTGELMEVLKRLQEARTNQNASIKTAHEIVLSHTLTLQGLNQIMKNEREISWRKQIDTTLHQLSSVALSDLMVENQ